MLGDIPSPDESLSSEERFLRLQQAEEEIRKAQEEIARQREQLEKLASDRVITDVLSSKTTVVAPASLDPTLLKDSITQDTNTTPPSVDHSFSLSATAGEGFTTNTTVKPADAAAPTPPQPKAEELPAAQQAAAPETPVEVPPLKWVSHEVTDPVLKKSVQTPESLAGWTLKQWNTEMDFIIGTRKKNETDPQEYSPEYIRRFTEYTRRLKLLNGAQILFLQPGTEHIYPVETEHRASGHSLSGN